MIEKAPNAIGQKGPVIVFDAMCVLCSANAQLVLRYDSEKRFRLASMQNEVGQSLYRECGIDPDDPDTLVVVEGNNVLRDSDAILSIYAGLDWPLRFLSVFRFVPKFVRDPVYRLIARNRYRLFGKRETCWLPTPEQLDRIL